ncbi:MAG TPA: hypothetical protein VHR72_00985 [Gemmataceae bacterium]|nr:hypothetical protein [Gemmataceae bacterium]
MRLATIERDFWQLRSGEVSHRQNPDEFWIPPAEQRDGLQRGQAARLIFDIEAQDEKGVVQIQGERMWVIVTEKISDTYIGILDNQPACLEPAEDVYLRFGAEVPFRAEHVIDIANPPKDYADWQLGQAPERVWLRDES